MVSQLTVKLFCDYKYVKKMLKTSKTLNYFYNVIHPNKRSGIKTIVYFSKMLQCHLYILNVKYTSNTSAFKNRGLAFIEVAREDEDSARTLVFWGF